jgi:hypothetical protein
MRTILPLFLISAVGLLVLGCGKSGSLGSSISGTLTYKAKPVPGGTLLFHANGKAFQASLAADGSYSVPDLPAGDYIVTIDTRHLKDVVGPEAMMRKMSGSDQIPEGMNKELSKVKEMRKDNPPQYRFIPDKYADVKTSGLKVTVQAGSNTKELELPD